MDAADALGAGSSDAEDRCSRHTDFVVAAAAVVNVT